MGGGGGNLWVSVLPISVASEIWKMIIMIIG